MAALPLQTKKPPEPNPFRDLGNAMEHWKAKLAVNNDAPPEEDGAGGEDNADNSEERPDAAEYEFLGSDAKRKEGDSQAGCDRAGHAFPRLMPGACYLEQDIRP